MKFLLFAVIVCAVVSVLSPGFSFAEKPMVTYTYPETKKIEHVDDYFGTKVEDPYRWLEDSNSPEVKQWIDAQQKCTDLYFSGIAFRPLIKKRLTELWNYESYSSLSKYGDYYIYRKNTGLQEQDIVYIRKGPNGKPEVLLDPNTLSKDGSITLTDLKVSEDYKYVAYGISRGGSDWREFFVMELKSKKKLADHIEWAKFTNLSFYKDGFFYSRYDKPEETDKLKAKLQSQKLYYHKVNTPQSADKLIYQDTKNPNLGFIADVSDNGKYLLISGWEGSSDFNYLFYKNLETDSPVMSLIDKPTGHFNFIDAIDDTFLVLTDEDAPNFKLVRIDPKKPQKENWEVIIPETGDKLDSVSLAGGKLVASYLKDVNSMVTVFDLKGKKSVDVQLPGIGKIADFQGSNKDNELVYSFSSFTVPSTYYRYNIKENKSEVLLQPKVKFDPGMFEIKEIFYESKDKTKVPLFIVYKKGILLNGENPTLLAGYGGFNISQQPRFRIQNIPFLETGGVYAVACIRGGGEYGETWHRAGMLDKKQNVFDDFIAAAEYLIKTGYTSPSKLAIYGGSNGGTLIGAVINQRPELFKVAVPEVGVMDMLRFQKFTIGWAWTGEYGSSDNPDQFKFLYAYSPLQNIKEGINYPATLILTADHDDRVFPAHSFKYAATLQAKYKGENPVILRVETKVGHGSGSSTSKQIEAYTDFFSFLFYNMRITPVFAL